MYQVAEVCEEETLVPLDRSPSRKASTAGDYDVDGDGDGDGDEFGDGDEYGDGNGEGDGASLSRLKHWSNDTMINYQAVLAMVLSTTRGAGSAGAKTLLEGQLIQNHNDHDIMISWYH